MFRKLIYFLMATFGIGLAVFWRFFKEDEVQTVADAESPIMQKIRYMMSEMYYYFHEDERPPVPKISANFLQRAWEYVGI